MLPKVLISPGLVRGSRPPICPHTDLWGVDLLVVTVTDAQPLSCYSTVTLQHLPLLGDCLLLDKRTPTSMFQLAAFLPS